MLNYMITKPTKYTKEFVKEQVDLILDEVLNNKDIVYIGEIFEKLPYPRQNWSEWAEKFKNVKIISDAIKIVDEILESRVNAGALKGKLNSSMAKFNLINNYGWRDETKIDHTTKGDKINYSNDQINAIIARYNQRSGTDSEEQSD